MITQSSKLKSIITRNIMANIDIKNKKVSVPSSYQETGIAAQPVEAFIDPINACNLKCPLCPTGRNSLNYPRSTMTLTTFNKVLDQLPLVKHIKLFNWGEPFLNPQIFAMISSAKQERRYVSIHSNFSLRRSARFFEELVDSGLDDLIISIDGASQESYSIYRVGGDFSLVIANIRELVKRKLIRNSSTPRITWKFIVSKFNQHEIDCANSAANDLGIFFVTDMMGLGDDLPDMTYNEDIDQRKAKWLPTKTCNIEEPYIEPRDYLYGGACYQLFYCPTIKPDGRVAPCCWVTDYKNTFGDLTEEPFECIWNNAKYFNSRHLFLSDGPGTVETICFRCNNYRKLYNGPIISESI